MNPENYFAPIAALDLDPIKVKLMHEESGEGWPRAYADAMEFEYRRFLYLVKQFPHEQVAPLFDVDVFWHYHILDTMKYAADCEAVFGYFLHHFPYVGLRGEEDVEAHHRVGERMRELYEQTYGEQYIRHAESADAATSQKTILVGSNKVAFSNPTAKVAFSNPTVKFAFSNPTAKFAFSNPTVAFSNPTVAFSNPTVVPAALGADTADFDASARAAAALFYSVRPSLPGTA